MIEVKNISKQFISAKKYPGLKGAVKGLLSKEKVAKMAVEDISFEIKDGEIVGYIGSNGAGKSTTIKIMTGILAPTTGKCIVNGVNPRKERKKNAQNIGVVFGQRTQLWWDLPLSESFTILKEIYNVSDEEYTERMKFLNNVLELEGFFDRPVRTLSLGQRMRADLGAALLHNPKVLFLDEPTIGLDLVVKDNIRQAIKEINQKYNTTVILTTHDIEDIEELCNRIIIIDVGKKIYDGTLAELKDKYGRMCTVTIEIKKAEDLNDLNLARELGIDEEESKLVVALDKKTMAIAFDKKYIQVPQVLNEVMKYTEVSDVKVQETKLSEIVKSIYHHGISISEDKKGMVELC